MAANSCYAVSTLQIARVKLNKANGGGDPRDDPVEMNFFVALQRIYHGPSKFRPDKDTTN